MTKDDAERLVDAIYKEFFIYSNTFFKIGDTSDFSNCGLRQKMPGTLGWRLTFLTI